MMKRKIAGLMALLLLMGMLGGCKDRQEDLGVSDDWIGVMQEQEEQEEQQETPDQKEENNKEPDSLPEDGKEEGQKKPSQQVPDSPALEKGEEETSKEEQPLAPKEEQEDQKEQKPMEKEQSGVPITFLSQNIRHSGTRLGVKGDGYGNDIYNRMRRFRSLVKNHDPDVIFYSEARKGAIEFMEEDPYFSQVYALHYRYEKKVQAEPLIYKRAKYEAVDQGFFWQSRTPTVPSGYDGSETIVSWALLKDKTSGAKFYCYSTHFRPGNKPEIALPSMEQFIELSKKMDKDAYAFFGGDFNVYYRQDVYNQMMDWDAVIDLRDMAVQMYNDRLCLLGGMRAGTNMNYDKATDNHNLMPQVKPNAHQIDYVMAKPNPHMAVDYYGFDYETYDAPEDGVQLGHISDHFGLVVKVRIQTDADYSRYQCQASYEDGRIYF